MVLYTLIPEAYLETHNYERVKRYDLSIWTQPIGQNSLRVRDQYLILPYSGIFKASVSKRLS